MPGAPSRTCEAWWSNWWGSPQLLARLLIEVERCGATVGATPSFSIRNSRRGWVEQYSTAQEFLHQVPPESLSGFDRIECALAGPLDVELVLRRHLMPRRTEEHGVTLRVTSEEGVEESVLLSATADLVSAVTRGFKPYWGRSVWPVQVLPRSRWVEHAHLLRRLLLVVLGVLLGMALARIIPQLPGAEDLGGLVPLATLLVGFAVPLVVNAAVPSVEVAAHGRTRGLVLTRRLAASAAAATGPPLTALLFTS